MKILIACDKMKGTFSSKQFGEMVENAIKTITPNEFGEVETTLNAGKYLSKYNDIWKERIGKYINKQLKTNKKSTYFFKNKMFDAEGSLETDILQ